MSSLRGQLDELVSGGAGEVEYRHEIALSTFTNDVARAMDAQGITQADLARTLGVSRARVSQIMLHKSSPTLRTMVQVASALGCDVSLSAAPCVGSASRDSVLPAAKGQLLGTAHDM